MMETNSRDTPGGAVGLFRSLTNMLATLIAIVQTRMELFTTELQEELRHAASLVLWALIALFTALIGVLLGGLTIVFAYWDTHRVLAAVLVTAAFVVFAIIAVLVMMIKIYSHRRLFDATLTELTKDAAALRSQRL
ncbi:MAG TPA: phage holin family protein [Steroidobacteraceae bacterium]|nr:phage holin family protein [Steroidobacteraceae bacterium]